MSGDPSPRLAVLRNRDFTFFLAARFLATLAVQMQTVAVGWQVYEVTRDPLDLGLIGLSQFLPFVLLILPAGHLADNRDRRRIIALCFALECVCALLLLALACARASSRRGRCSRSWCCSASPARSRCRPARRCCRTSCRASSSAPRSRSIPRPGRSRRSPARRSAASSTSPARPSSTRRSRHCSRSRCCCTLHGAPRRRARRVDGAARAAHAAARGCGSCGRAARCWARSRWISSRCCSAARRRCCRCTPRTCCTWARAASGCCARRPGSARRSAGSSSASAPISRHVGRWMFGGVVAFGVATIVFGAVDAASGCRSPRSR